MPRQLLTSSALVALIAAAGLTTTAYAQDQGATPPPADTPPATGTPPASGAADPQLPDVQIIQEQPPAPTPPPTQEAAPKPKPKPVASKPRPRPQAAPVQDSPPPLPPEPEFVADPEPVLENSPYGAVNSQGAARRAEQAAQTPVNPTAITPQNLEGFAGSATNVTSSDLTAKQPRNINEAFTSIPGVIVINDDASGHHGGIGLRGSPARRSRKVLVMEDGHPVNLALWLDPSVHFFAPVDRIEGIEVIKGTVITHGPNNNFGVINVRNLSPFGPDENVVSSAIGFTKSKTGSFQPTDDGEPDGEPRTGSNDTDISARWHVHTRKTFENVGLVLSYTGENVQGSWDTERLRFNDFYGALGWKGVDQDLTVSVSHARQRDNYDEQNFLTEYEADFVGTPAEADDFAEQLAEDNRGGAERAFFGLKHCKTCFAPASDLNTYNGDIWRGQIVHNAYVDDDTTITTRLYAGEHRRDRYQLISYDSDPDGDEGLGPQPLIEDGEQIGYIFGEDTMFGRLRTFRHIGGEVRTEFANRHLLGFKQDIQAGIRYEFQDMSNRNFLGVDGEILRDGDEDGATLFDRSLRANTVSAFLQTNIYVAKDFNVVPGIRFEWYGVNRRNRVIAEEESEAGGCDDDDTDFGDDCLQIDGINFEPDQASESYDTFNALPGIAFAYTGFHKTTIFGGYHRGLSTGVLRNETFPAPDEIGDNFSLGMRSSAIRGFDFEVTGFHQIIQDYQFGASFNDGGDRSFGRADEVEISGVELAGRLNSQPFTGGSLNFYGQANYTYSRGIFTDAPEFDDEGEPTGENFNGNRLPEVPFHVAALTLGVEQRSGWRWDASMTWTYRGSFFTDEGNTAYGVYEGECEQGAPAMDAGDFNFECEVEEAGEDGQVPSVWLLSARFNMDIGDTGASVFVAGDNLLDDLYISDREDGIKPGLGRTVWTGFKYKF
jgi:Fe(3+) dicitrate transport protein